MHKDKRDRAAYQRAWQAKHPGYHKKRATKLGPGAQRRRKATRSEPATCEICGGPPNGRSNTMCLDHCHTTGEFRGWLCNRCNLTLGLVKDDTELMVKMIVYLTPSRAVPSMGNLGPDQPDSAGSKNPGSLGSDTVYSGTPSLRCDQAPINSGESV